MPNLSLAQRLRQYGRHNSGNEMSQGGTDIAPPSPVTAQTMTAASDSAALPGSGRSPLKAGLLEFIGTVQGQVRGYIASQVRLPVPLPLFDKLAAMLVTQLDNIPDEALHAGTAAFVAHLSELLAADERTTSADDGGTEPEPERTEPEPDEPDGAAGGVRRDSDTPGGPGRVSGQNGEREISPGGETDRALARDDVQPESPDC